MKHVRTLVPLLLLGMTVLSVPAAAQEVVMQLQPDSKLWIEGTSNKSDWKVDAGTMSGTVKMTNAANPAVGAVQVRVPAAKIVSNKSTIMDRLMHETLKVEEHPEVVFVLKEAKAQAGAKAGTFVLQTKGNLTLAGVTKEITLPVQGEKLADGRVRFAGSHALLMTDYGMKPPMAMFGALHTADKVTVHFNLVAAPGSL